MHRDALVCTGMHSCAQGMHPCAWECTGVHGACTGMCPVMHKDALVCTGDALVRGDAPVMHKRWRLCARGWAPVTRGVRRGETESPWGTRGCQLGAPIPPLTI